MAYWTGFLTSDKICSVLTVPQFNIDTKFCTLEIQCEKLCLLDQKVTGLCATKHPLQNVLELCI